MWVRWARLSIVHKIDGLCFKSLALLALLALLAPQKVWHLPKIWDDRQKVPKVPLTTPLYYQGIHAKNEVFWITDTEDFRLSGARLSAAVFRPPNVSTGSNPIPIIGASDYRRRFDYVPMMYACSFSKER